MISITKKWLNIESIATDLQKVNFPMYHKQT